MGDAGDDRDASARAVRRTAVARALALLWAAPASLLGLLLAPVFETRRTTRGVLVCEGTSWPGRLGWKYRAITFGHVVLSVGPLDDRVLEHELAHVRQYERWGILLWPAYGIAALSAKLRGRDAYWDNHFERQARGERPG